MKFKVVDSRLFDENDTCYLLHGSWDDWFRYATSYRAFYLDQDMTTHDLGTVKIGQYGMGSGHAVSSEARPGQLRSPELPSSFNDLSSDVYFSVGQDASYYEMLNGLGPIVRDEILLGLNDLALAEGLLQKALNESVTTVSLLRFVARSTVEGQFRRIARGGARLSRYKFQFEAASSNARRPPVLFDVDVVPESQPPSNIHVLIGRNGVGKTRLLNGMARDLLGYDTDVGRFSFETDDGPEGFSNLVSVSFSAFDSIDPIKARRNSSVKSHYIGLKRPPDPDGKPLAPKSPSALAREFSFSVAACLEDERRSRWRRALALLESDPVFADANVAELAEVGIDEIELRSQATALYRDRLSSGHKIVLLTITRLVETVEERSLVLLDEPEAHLHPPLLSAFVRALSDLLINRNGVAIVATHSPVVLQEVPASCAWILQRSGKLMAVQRPSIETFGESVGILTHEVFGLEVTKAGFHRLIDEAVDDAVDFGELLERFSGQLGGEARGIARGLIATRADGAS